MDFELVRRDTAEREAAEAYERGKAEGRAEAAKRRPPAATAAATPAQVKPKAAAKAKPRKVIEHLCPNVDPMSGHRGRIVIGADRRGECDWCHTKVFDDS